MHTGTLIALAVAIVLALPLLDGQYHVLAANGWWYPLAAGR